MRTLKLFEDEKFVDELDAPESFAVVRSFGGSVDCWTPYMRTMRYSDNFVLRQEYQERAIALVREYSERLMYVEPHRIAFAVDEAWKLKESATPNSKVKVDITRLGKLFALGDGFDYVIHIKGYYLERWTDAQINAAIMSQLLRINNSDGKILEYQDDAANPLVATLGAGYLEPQTVIPDLLKEHVSLREFRRADGQMSFDDIDAAGAAASVLAEGQTEDTNTCGMCAYWNVDHGDMGSCDLEVVDGMIADTHPACTDFGPDEEEDEDDDDNDAA